jgi:hypothetical protein
MNRNATTKVRLELVKHEGGQFAAGPLPDPPGTSPGVSVSFDKAKSFRDNGARTHLHRRALGCDSSLLVAWKAPAGVLGNEPMFVASGIREGFGSPSHRRA